MAWVMMPVSIFSGFMFYVIHSFSASCEFDSHQGQDSAILSTGSNIYILSVAIKMAAIYYYSCAQSRGIWDQDHIDLVIVVSDWLIILCHWINVHSTALHHFILTLSFGLAN